MKVLFLQRGAKNAGSQNSLLLLVKELQRMGWECGCVCDEDGWLGDKLRILGVPVFITPLPQWTKARDWLYMPYALLKLYRIVKKLNPSIIHANSLKLTPYAVICARLVGARAVCHMRIAIERALQKKVREYLIRKADAIITVSSSLRDDLINAGVPVDKLFVVYNGVDLDRFNTHQPDLRSTLGFGRGDFLITEVGSICHRKGQDLLISACERIRGEIPNLKILFCGVEDDGEYKERLLRQIKEAGLEKDVKFLGVREDVPAIIAASDILCLPSRNEGFPRVLLEAMALGKPCVATDVGGTRELVEDRATGLLVEQEDAAALADTILRLYRDEALRRRIAYEGCKRVREKFSSRKTAELISKIYSRLLGCDVEQRQGQAP